MIIFSYRAVLWYYTYYLVTNQRLRYVQRFGLFKQTTLDLDLASIESVQYQTLGLVSEVARYGTLTVNATSGELTINKVAQVKKMYNLLQDLIKKESTSINEDKTVQ